MLTLVPEAIEKYAAEHTTPLPVHMRRVVADTYANMKDPEMLSGVMEGSLLQFLVWASGARRILEVGTFTGFSAQMMAAALPPGGEVITCELDPKTAEVARRNIAKGPHAAKIEVKVGPALETIATLKPPFDLVFIDADKEGYPSYYEAALRLLSPKGIIAVDNVLWSGTVLKPRDKNARAIAAFNERVRRDRRVVHVLLTVRDGVMLIRRRDA
jgi:caffeoyl-CoA O-methyltransferase